MPLRFLALSAEIRMQIYRHALVRNAVIANRSVQLSGQLLRTCRQIFHEATPILYGCNTFKLTVVNTTSDEDVAFEDRGPFTLDRYYNKLDDEEEQDLDDQLRGPLQLMRRFKVVIVHDLCQHLDVIRDDLDTCIKVLNKVPQINYLRVKYKYTWHTHYPFRTAPRPNEVAAMLGMAFGQYRGIQTVVFDDVYGWLPAGFPKALKVKMEGTFPPSEPRRVQMLQDEGVHAGGGAD